MRKITVNASKTYDVVINKNILDTAGLAIRAAAGGQSAVIVSDDKVEEIYGKRLAETLVKNDYAVSVYVFPNGEESKNPEMLVSLVNYFAEKKLTRSDVVIALGGGVTGDLAGFAAACYMRGTRFVQIPTTLLSAVDSSVGGKTAVNLDAGKNLFGVFYQPDLVLCDTTLLATLSGDNYKDGCAETIKYGIIADEALFNSLKTPIKQQFEDVIARCIEIKRDIVEKDEFESTDRMLLNFGHTIGHAVEKLSNYEISHGHAVAIGMAVESRIAVGMKLCSASVLNDILDMLQLYGLPTHTSYSVADITRACLSDKKRDGGGLTFVLPTKIGNCILKKIPILELERTVEMGLEQL